MLDRFKVPVGDQVRVPEESLRATVAAIFEKMGESPENAALAADTLVSADLRGVSSHGVSVTFPVYLKYYRDGTIKANAKWTVLRETPGVGVTDGDLGLGVILAPKAMRMAIDKARRVGIGIVTIVNSAHSGAIGHHAMVAAKEDMVGVAMTAAGMYMHPTFGSVARLGTNPIAVAAPTRHEAPFLFDAATTTISGNKIQIARSVGAKLAPGWVAEKDGVPIMEEIEPLEMGEHLPLPLGGTRENGSHKGYGLAMMVEVLTTVLSGIQSSMVEDTRTDKHYFAAYDIAAFSDVDEFKDNMDRMLETLRTTEPIPGHDRVLYPGLMEHEEEQERRANGIPLHRDVVKWFEDQSDELDVPRLVIRD